MINEILNNLVNEADSKIKSYSNSKKNPGRKKNSGSKLDVAKVEAGVGKQDKNNYGIVYTPFFLTEKIISLIPQHYFQNPELRWLDVGAGNGVFSIIIYKRLFDGLKTVIPDTLERHSHIIEKMLYLVELYPPHIERLREIFGESANIIDRCFLSLHPGDGGILGGTQGFDFIVGNPPYNTNGAIKTPTNHNIKKTDDGRAIYVDFVFKSLELLHVGGFLSFIIPNIWLKPDRAGLYNRLTGLKIHNLCCLSTDETIRSFNYQAQTPTCYFLIENTSAMDGVENEDKNNTRIPIWDNLYEKFVPYRLLPDFPIPCHGVSIINRLMPFIEKYGFLSVLKTNCPSKTVSVRENRDDIYKYPNIRTCVLGKAVSKAEAKAEKTSIKIRDTDYVLSIDYSDKPCVYSGCRKIVLAHKMYGIPFFDREGKYGISARDNYVVLGSNDVNANANADADNMLEEIYALLTTRFAQFIFSVCNYRMRYLERYAFQFIPDITHIEKFPSLRASQNANNGDKDKLIARFFGFTQEESKYIDDFCRI